jgi:hypothetical protein
MTGVRNTVIDALSSSGGATHDQCERARASLARGDVTLVSALRAAGIDAGAIRDACARACALSTVPEKWLKNPKPPPLDGLDASALYRLGVAPAGVHKGRLCLAYEDPEVAAAALAHGFPEHRALLGTAEQVRRLYDAAFGPQTAPHEKAQSGEDFGAGVYRMDQTAQVSVAEAPGAAPRLPTDSITALGGQSESYDPEATLMDPRRGAIDDYGLGEDHAATVRTPRVDEAAATVALEALEPPEAEQKPKGKLAEARQQALEGLTRFTSKSVLGRGGMATVYLADDAQTGREVALKLMEPHLADDETFVERFRREMRSSAELDHENIVKLFDAGAQGESFYMATEFVDGGTIRDLLAATGPLPPALVAPFLYQVLRGLAHAHEGGIVHRDLKPANLMLSSQGLAKICDFGIAKKNTDNTITQTGMVFGTPAYMSPEQAFGQPLDGRSDLFSISSVCYELLTGTNPYNHDNVSTSLLLVSRAEARPLGELCPWMPQLLGDVLARLGERDRGKRFRDAASAANMLQPLVEAIEQRHGKVLARLATDPAACAAEFRQGQADLEVRLAQGFLLQDEPRNEEAALRFYLATRLSPGHPVATQSLQDLQREHGFRFDLEPDAKIEEIEEALKTKPDSPALLRRGADLAMQKNNLLLGVAWMRRYLRDHPGDQHMQHRLLRVVGNDPLAPFGAGPAAAAQASPQLASAPVGDTSIVERVPTATGEPGLALPDWGDISKPGANKLGAKKQSFFAKNKTVILIAAAVGFALILALGLLLKPSKGKLRAADGPTAVE